MSRGWIWLQLLIAWLPMWALFAALIMIVHGAGLAGASIGSLRMIVAAALLGVGVYKFASRRPWPYPFRLAFVAIHLLAAVVYAVSWYVLISLIDSAVQGHLVFFTGPGLAASLITGFWLYIVVAGVAYANLAAQRNAKNETHAARMQLDALRAQLHPHFLFNALHTVVQLIPFDPRAASRATEQLAALLRTTMQEQRDLIPLSEEFSFVERYLEIESIRFGERLRIDIDISEAARSALLPSFALQTLIENAVRHGAAPRIETTRVTVSAALTSDMLVMKVVDDGVGADIPTVENSAGSGLRRLRERMRWLYGNQARLHISSDVTGGFTAIMSVPQAAREGETTPPGQGRGERE